MVVARENKFFLSFCQDQKWAAWNRALVRIAGSDGFCSLGIDAMPLPLPSPSTYLADDFSIVKSDHRALYLRLLHLDRLLI